MRELTLYVSRQLIRHSYIIKRLSAVYEWAIQGFDLAELTS